MTWLLQVDPFKAFQQYLESRNLWTSVAWNIGIGVGFVVMLVIIYRVQLRRSQPRHHDNPMRLFRSVLRKLGLTLRQRELLMQVARDVKVPHPTVMLLSPALFNEHAGRWLSNHASPSAGASTRTLLALQGVAKALFGALADDDPLTQPSRSRAARTTPQASAPR